MTDASTTPMYVAHAIVALITAVAAKTEDPFAVAVQQQQLAQDTRAVVLRTKDRRTASDGPILAVFPALADQLPHAFLLQELLQSSGIGLAKPAAPSHEE